MQRHVLGSSAECRSLDLSIQADPGQVVASFHLGLVRAHEVQRPETNPSERKVVQVWNKTKWPPSLSERPPVLVHRPEQRLWTAGHMSAQSLSCRPTVGLLVQRLHISRPTINLANVFVCWPDNGEPKKCVQARSPHKSCASRSSWPQDCVRIWPVWLTVKVNQFTATQRLSREWLTLRRSTTPGSGIFSLVSGQHAEPRDKEKMSSQVAGHSLRAALSRGLAARLLLLNQVLFPFPQVLAPVSG